MVELSLTADELVSAALKLSLTEPVCILDSCGVDYLGSHQMIVGVRPSETIEVSSRAPSETLDLLDVKMRDDRASIFTLSYELGPKILGIPVRYKPGPSEPDVFISTFDALIIHDYDAHQTRIVGDAAGARRIRDLILGAGCGEMTEPSVGVPAIVSNFTKAEYLAAIETIKEYIRAGDTYQTNLTQQFSADLPLGLTPQAIFRRLRRDHPAPFAAFITRKDSTVVSASPERFCKIGRNPTGGEGALRTISTSPIKGTRKRGQNSEHDARLKADLVASPKDRAENTMIVDLLRNDLGRVCEYGSVKVERLCETEEHPTFFHLVSTISGELRETARFSDVLTAVFPCGSITGAPKISTMKIIDELEPTRRSLSMGAIGYRIPSGFGIPECTDLSVAIRTMVIRNGRATFNVGGGIVIDSDPESEFQETLTKAQALFAALGQDL